MSVFSNKPGEYSTSFGVLVVPESGLVYTSDEGQTEELKRLGFEVTSAQENPSGKPPEPTRAEKADEKKSNDGKAFTKPPTTPPDPAAQDRLPGPGEFPATVEAESGPGGPKGK